jgi:cytoskeletal protein CcmA (bactofilin family)
VTHLGQTIVVKGHVKAAEDIAIAGRIEGDVQMDGHVLLIHATGQISAEVMAKSVIVEGAVSGDIVAVQNIALRDTANVEGKMAAPKIAISAGAQFNGHADTTAATS